MDSFLPHSYEFPTTSKPLGSPRISDTTPFKPHLGGTALTEYSSLRTDATPLILHTTHLSMLVWKCNIFTSFCRHMHDKLRTLSHSQLLLVHDNHDLGLLCEQVGMVTTRALNVMSTTLRFKYINRVHSNENSPRISTCWTLDIVRESSATQCYLGDFSPSDALWKTARAKDKILGVGC